ncbi:thymidine phosphorylase [Iodidimonas muriae]|uniref:Thymidine phosphorylase n=1 Tax=Iodidimonas muriae TaxID=261467 RepID=A0ABQ2L765_9PROT|nr:thymidine phosphorylase [Iodidimonas muriae]GER06655.1 thymidine phosphorylase [Kordiimonadales bacterium JCM 17843]GGO05678.1 thymidine phosphorylase [Iodidimonas muriae]
MLFKDVIRKKRDGGALSAEEIDAFVSGLADGSLPAEQVSALAMAIFLKSMSFEEAGALTLAMAKSGVMLDWSQEDLDGPVVDKHSTGGVGDKVSFMLAAIAASCGCYVPMISGRGLGHTGGTLDKIASIPGYNPTPGLDVFRKVTKEVGCAIIGQTSDLAPADRRLYAIRDISGTVESIPLITASILSKKIAAGNRSLVMDVKVGTGAFMESIEEARALARSIIGTAKAADLTTHALITDMSQVLGDTAGNSVEIEETVEYLTNSRRESRLDEVVLALAAEMLITGGLADNREEATERANEAVTSGRAAEVFAKMVTALGGPADFIERYQHYLPKASVVVPVLPETEGYVSAVDARAIGNAIIELGGGRRAVDDVLDLSVGFDRIAPIGAKVGPDRPLAFVHAASKDNADRAAENLRAATHISDKEPADSPVIYDILTSA